MERQPTQDPHSVTAVADQIAAHLNETEPGPLKQIKAIVHALGIEAALNLLAETQQVEANTGLLVADGSRRRTPGGVFFYLARQRVPPKQRRAIWPPQRQAAKRSAPPFDWADRLEIVPQLLATPGEAQTVKITLIGRPGRVVAKGDVVLTTMQNTKAPSLPKGLPKPPDQPTTYVVFIAHKQWRQVAEAIQNPADSLIIEGYPAFDERLQAMTVFALSTTTKLLQQARREAQQQQAQE